MENYRDPKESRKAIGAFAFRVSRRLKAAGDHSLTNEDIQQELWCAWCIAVDRYDPSGGVPFLAYLRSGMQKHINRYVEKHVTRRFDEVGALSLDYEMDGNGDTPSMSFSEIIPAPGPSPIERLQEEDALRVASRYLSEPAKQFLKFVHEQPKELLDQVLIIGERCAHAKTRGQTIAFNNRITANLIFELLDIHGPHRAGVLGELRDAASRIQDMEAQ